jgi:predicted homoserine dehydrogenase-like protein
VGIHTDTGAKFGDVHCLSVSASAVVFNTHTGCIHGKELLVTYTSRLRDHALKIGRDTRIALVGAGQMGRGFGNQLGRKEGISLSIIIDTDLERVKVVYADLGITDVVFSEDKEVLSKAILDGKHTGSTNANLVSELPVDLVVEGTGVPDIGAQITYVEMDVTIGPLLHKVATDNGVIYAVCHGDEPIEAKVLVDYARDLNFEIICAGKGKNNPFEPLSTPDTVREIAIKKKMNPKMLCSFTDGSKTMTEMVALANTTGLQLSKRGMYGPASSVKTLQDTFALAVDGGVLDRPGVVDYCTGDVAPGVFVIVRHNDPYIAHEMSYLAMGPGPYFALYRPFHLASIEAPITVYRAILDRESSLYAPHLNAEVVTMSKKELAVGDVIDGIGGYTVRGYADNALDAKRDNLVPIGLIAGAKIIKPIGVGELLTYDHVELNQDSFIVALRKKQDELGLTYAPDQK